MAEETRLGAGRLAAVKFKRVFVAFGAWTARTMRLHVAFSQCVVLGEAPWPLHFINQSSSIKRIGSTPRSRALIAFDAVLDTCSCSAAGSQENATYV